MSSKTSPYDQSGGSSRAHRRRLLAAVCLTATLTCVPVAAGGQSGEGPGQLWQEFPLDQKQAPPPRKRPQAPRPATTPVPGTNPAPTTLTTPAKPEPATSPAETEPTPAETVDRASVSDAGESSGGWPVAAKAAIALSGVGLVGFLLLALTSLLEGRRRTARHKAVSPSSAARPGGEDTGSRFHPGGRRPKRRRARYLRQVPTALRRAEPADESEPRTVAEPFAEVITAAQETAEEIRAQATADAQRIRAEAREEVEASAQQRRKQAAGQVAQLRKEAARVRSEADGARARAKEAVDAHVEEHRRSVQERAARLKREADAEAERFRARAKEHAHGLEAAGAGLRASVREQTKAVEVLERMLGSLERIDLSPPGEAQPSAAPEKQPDQTNLGDRVRQWTQPSDT